MPAKLMDFFLLDLEGTADGEALLKDAEIMFDLNTNLYALDEEVLLQHKFQPPGNLLGYKPPGSLKADQGKRDDIQMYSIGQDEILGVLENCTGPKRGHPPLIEAHREEFATFTRHAHRVLETILSQLDRGLGLDKGTLLSSCSFEKASQTSIRVLRSKSSRMGETAQHHDSETGPQKANEEVSLGGHNDIGSITILFNVSGGLQVLPAGCENKSDNWQYIRPRPGCAIVNIGDSLVELTGGVLRSSLHRVVSPPGDQARHVRQSIAYLVRQHDDGFMDRLQSHNGVIPPLAAGEQDEHVSVKDWSAQTALRIVNGTLKAETRGGHVSMLPKTIGVGA